MLVNPGELNKKIEIKKSVITTNENLVEIETLETVRKTWARVSNISGTEMIKSGADMTTVNTRFLIRKTDVTIDADMFILFRDDIYDITYVNNYAYSDEYLDIVAVRRKI